MAEPFVDVVSQEPVPLDNPVLKLDNFVFTPHVAPFPQLHSGLMRQHPRKWTAPIRLTSASSRKHIFPWPVQGLLHRRLGGTTSLYLQPLSS